MEEEDQILLPPPPPKKSVQNVQQDQYDYKTAIEAGLGPDETGHWPSRDPQTGKILKSPSHPTFQKTLEGEAAMGYEVYQDESGQYYSRPKSDLPPPPPPRKKANITPENEEEYFQFLDEDKDKPWYLRRFVPTQKFNDLIKTPSSVIGQFGRTAAEGVIADPLKLLGAITQKAASLWTGLPLPPAKESNPIYQIGQKAEELIEGQTFVDPELENTFPVQVGGGLGTAASIMATGGFSGFTKAAGLAPRLLSYGKQALQKMLTPAGVVAGAMNAVPEYEAAIAAGKSEDEAFKVMLLNYGVGQTDIIPLSNMMSRLNNSTGGLLVRTIKNMGAGAVEEALQETFQTYLTNKIAEGSYDPDRDPLVGLAEAAGLGAFIGALIPGGGAIAQRAMLKAEVDEAAGAVADTGDPVIDHVIDTETDETTKTVIQAEEVRKEADTPSGIKDTESTENIPERVQNEIVVTPRAEEKFSDWEYTDEVGGTAKGVISGEIANISEAYAAPETAEDKEKFEKRGFLTKLINKLQEKGVKHLSIPLQSSNMEAALKRLVEKGTLSNPRNEVIEGIPTLFTIGGSSRNVNTGEKVNIPNLVKEFNETGSLVGQTEKKDKIVLAENVADFLREKGVNSQEDVDSFIDAWNELPIEGKPVLKIADSKRIGELLVEKPTKSPQEKITLTFEQAVQDLNKAMEKGIRRGQKLVNENLIPKVQEALKGANLTPRQTSVILTKLKNTNLFTPGSSGKLNEFISSVVGDANYADALGKASSLKKRVKKFGRQKAEKIPVNYKVLARQFGQIDPTQMTKRRLNEYLEKAEGVIGGFRPVESAKYAPIDVSGMEEYIQSQLDVQDEEIEKVLEETPNDSDELKMLAQGSLDRLNEKDLSSFDEREKRIIEKIKTINPSKLVGGELVQKREQDQLKRLIKTVDNIVTNDDLSGEAFIENLAAVENFVDEFGKLQKTEKSKISEIGLWGRTMYNMSNMVKRLYQNDKVEAYFRSFVHGPVLTAGSQVEKAVVDASQGFDKKLKSLNKKYDTELRNIDNKADMMVFSLLYQTDNEIDIAKIHRNIKEVIRRNREVGNDVEANAWEKSYEPFTNVENFEQAKNIIKRKNPAIYDMWKFFGSDNESQDGIFTEELANEQAKVAKEVYNREYAPTARYTPIVQHDVNTLYRIAETIQEGGPNQRQVNIKPSQARTAKRRTLNLAPNKVYTLEPYTDWVLRYGETVYDNKASKEEAKLAELIVRPEFTKLVGGNDNAVSLADALDRLVSIQRGTNRIIASNEAENFFTELAKTFRSIGTVKALASFSQALKQSTVTVKTLANLISTSDVDVFMPAIHAVTSMKTDGENSPVKKLLDQSTLIARGLRLGGTDRGTSEAYKLQRGATKWFYKILEDSRTTLDKRTRASLSLLVRPDIFNARIAFVSYYLQSLKQQGVDVDMNTEYKRQEEPERKQAMAYAENMVEKTQTASNPAAMSAIQAQTQSKGWEFVKTVFLPFSTFDADFKARLTNEVSAIKKSPTTENAIKLGGTISEALVFATLNAFLLYWYKEFLRDAVRAVTGAEAPEKTDEQIDKEQRQQFVSSVTSALNPLAIGTIPQEAQSKIINEIGYITNNPDNLDKKEWLKTNALVYEPREGTLLENLGAYSTGISPLKEIANTLPQYKSILGFPITLTDAYGNQRDILLSDEQKTILFLKGIAETLTLAGLTEADVANAIRTVYREEMKKSGEAPTPAKNTKTTKRQFE